MLVHILTLIQFGIEVISGTDSNIQFKKQRNMVKEKDYE